MEQTIEEDVFRLAPPGVGAHFTRVRMPNDVTVENLDAVTSELAGAAALLLPEGDLDVVCYACTSGSIVIGEERAMAELSRGAPAARATTLVTGVIRALRALQAKRIVVATPYLDEINALEARYLEERGFEILDIQGLNIRRDADMVRVAPDFIREFAKSVDRPDAEAVFVSCGALRTLDIVEALEQEVGKPVVASNQAMIWDTLRLAGIEDEIDGYGRLFRLY
jgi:maleate isomerase